MPKVSDIRVPNQYVKGSKIVLIGESPGQDEEDNRQPFVGVSGQLLLQTLGKFGVTRNEVSLLNLCQYRPFGNKFDILEEDLDGKRKLFAGVKEVKEYISTHKPNVVGLLGEKPLNYIAGKYGIGRYRGSILPAANSTIKTVAIRHPTFIQRNEEEYPIFETDIKRLVGEADSPALNYTKRDYHIVSGGLELIDWWQKLSQKKLLACDIENLKPTINKKKPEKSRPLDMLCVGFAYDKHNAVVFPWNMETKPVIKSLLENPDIHIIFHYGMHDANVLYLFGIDVANYSHDTLVMQNSLEPEMPRSLDFLTSIYTREPYYKQEGRGDLPEDSKVWAVKTDRNKVYVYNGKDCCCTYEIAERLLEEIEKDESAKKTYQHKMDCVPIALDMSRTGMCVDLELRETFKQSLLHKWAGKQQILNAIAGRSVNVESKTKDMPWLLYEKLKLPVRRNRNTGITTDEDALISLMTFCTEKIKGLVQEKAIAEWEIKLEACRLIQEIRGVRKMLSTYIEAKLSDDNKLRSTYKVANTEMDRWAAEMWVDKTGLNGQTFPRGYITVVEKLEPLPSLDEMLKQLESEEENEDS
jgi:uracil-DNA glycosylase family 4